MQEERHDRVVEMRLCFFLGKVGDYKVSLVETRMCRSTFRVYNQKYKRCPANPGSIVFKSKPWTVQKLPGFFDVLIQSWDNR